jgi:hypothetical protein
LHCFTESLMDEVLARLMARYAPLGLKPQQILHVASWTDYNGMRNGTSGMTFANRIVLFPYLQRLPRVNPWTRWHGTFKLDLVPPKLPICKAHNVPSRRHLTLFVATPWRMSQALVNTFFSSIKIYVGCGPSTLH